MELASSRVNTGRLFCQCGVCQYRGGEGVRGSVSEGERVCAAARAG